MRAFFLFILLVLSLLIFVACENINDDIEMVSVYSNHMNALYPTVSEPENNAIDWSAMDFGLDFIANNEQQRKWAYDITKLRNHIFNIHPRFANANVDLIMDVHRNMNMGLAFNDKLESLLVDAQNMTKLEVMINLRYSLAMLNDNHLWFRDFEVILREYVFPLEFKFFSDGIFLIKAIDELNSFLNLEVVAINQMPISCIIDTYLTYLNFENVYDARSALGLTLYLRSPIGLSALGIDIDAGVVYTLKNFYGSVFELYIDTAYNISDLEFMTVQADESPLFLSNYNDAIWTTFIEEKGIVYIRINFFPYSGWTIYRLETIQAFNAAKASGNLNAVVVDARYNVGGHTNMGIQFIDYILHNAPDGRLFYFINESSFSASILYASYVANRGGTLIGQPPGQNVYFFSFDGDLDVSSDFFIELPYSGFQIFVPNSLLSIEHCSVLFEDMVLYPDILVDYTISDWINGEDPLLTYVINSFLDY